MRKRIILQKTSDWYIVYRRVKSMWKLFTDKKLALHYATELAVKERVELRILSELEEIQYYSWDPFPPRQLYNQVS